MEEAAFGSFKHIKPYRSNPMPDDKDSRYYVCVCVQFSRASLCPSCFPLKRTCFSSLLRLVIAEIHFQDEMDFFGGGQFVKFQAFLINPRRQRLNRGGEFIGMRPANGDGRK